MSRHNWYIRIARIGPIMLFFLGGIFRANILRSVRLMFTSRLICRRGNIFLQAISLTLISFRVMPRMMFALGIFAVMTVMAVMGLPYAAFRPICFRNPVTLFASPFF